VNLSFNAELAAGYSSNSQKIRVMSEEWVGRQAFCPNCGEISIDKYPNNSKAADFFCQNCQEDYELKSKSSALGAKIVDGAYHAMIERLRSATNPNFFLLSYDPRKFDVSNFLVIPKHFFVPQLIEQRRPLPPHARRAGWIGCTINLQSIPDSGRIFFVKSGSVQSRDSVLAEWRRTLFLRSEKDLTSKSWTVDVMNCVERLGKHRFSLADIYAFEGELRGKYPNNHHIREKIRQQLQVLRDNGYLEFSGRGQYRLI
jgi:type II restriction enzyme